MNLPAPQIVILPRLIRLRDVSAYLGMDRNRFAAEVRPYVTTIPIGKQGIAFDRLELDAWVEDYVSRNGRPGRLQGVRPWDVEDRPASSRERAFGTSTSGSKGGEFAKALAQINSQKRSDISQD
jgi:predicted DNA-binding transcriptional regulator AlpA